MYVIYITYKNILYITNKIPYDYNEGVAKLYFDEWQQGKISSVKDNEERSFKITDAEGNSTVINLPNPE